jgi:phasin family protein
MDRGTKVFDEMGEFSRGNLEAIAESGRIMARGVEAMGQEAAAFAKRAYESQLAAFRTLSAVKNPTDLFKIQGDLVRKSFDAAVAETSRNTEATLKLAGEVAQPLQNRLALAAEKIKTAA